MATNTPDQNVIPGFRKMSKQRIMDMARAHINRTRKPSLNDAGGYCVYAGSGCNAAPLLKPSMRSRLDKVGSWTILVSENKVPANNEQFIIKLQSAHDEAAHTNGDFIHTYNVNMTKLAKEFGLVYNPI